MKKTVFMATASAVRLSLELKVINDLKSEI